MANMDISPEDREILAKTKFKQWFTECFDEAFPIGFDGRLTEYAKLSDDGINPTNVTNSGKTASDDSNTPKQGRRSLMSVAMEQALGL